MLKEFEKRLLSSLLLIPIAVFFIFQGSVFFIFFLSLLFLATGYEWVKMIKKNNFMKIFGIIFLFFSFLLFYQNRKTFLCQPNVYNREIWSSPYLCEIHSGRRSIFSILRPFASSSTSLSRYRHFFVSGVSMSSTR